MKNIYEAVAVLAYSQCFCLKAMEADFSGDNTDKDLSDLHFAQYASLHQLIYEKLGFEYESNDFLESLKYLKSGKYLEFTFKNSIEKNTIAEKIKNYHGANAYVIFLFVVALSNLAFLCSSASSIKEMIEKEKSRTILKRIRAQEKMMIDNFKNLISIFPTEIESISYFDQESLDNFKVIDSIMENNSGYDLDLMTKLNDSILTALNLAIPSRLTDSGMENGKLMIRELKKLKPGKVGWKKYEDFCIKVLKFIFLPPFRKVHVQAKTLDGYERRDAIIPNNSNTFFWNNIKSEFDCKNIVCEFKNLADGGDKISLNQLRVYLLKKTIGRFGLLFVRSTDKSKSILKARHDAYGQSNILILIIDDALLEKLILSKMYFGSCDDLLEAEKVRFEINY